MRMEESRIRMYLMYWFKADQNEREVLEYLSRLGFDGCKFVRTKRGAVGASFSEFCVNTCCLDDITAEFLKMYSPKVDSLNEFSDKYAGKYILEIVPEMYNEERPAIFFEREFLDFIKQLKNLDSIDVDQYFYWE